MLIEERRRSSTARPPRTRDKQSRSVTGKTYTTSEHTRKDENSHINEANNKSLTTTTMTITAITATIAIAKTRRRATTTTTTTTTAAAAAAAARIAKLS